VARTSRADTARTHQRILTQASEAFRESGVPGVSIPALMKAVGLTHGTFYAHFASKEALVVETCARCFDEVVDGLLRPAEQAREDQKLDAVLDTYLSTAHRDDPAHGCFLPTLAAEIRRESPPVRHTFSDALKRYFGRLAAVLPRPAAGIRQDRELVLASGLVGAIVLARAVDDPALSDRILQACRNFYSEAFAEEE
jgi:TetR/AcrR family transcriptional regulator, transcriptional repressor for nem operon